MASDRASGEDSLIARYFRPLATEPAKVVEGDKPLPEPEPESRVRRSTFPPAEQPPVVVQRQ